MVIIEDTRQKINKHAKKNADLFEMGVRVIRCKLPVGDYAVFPSVSVDTKENISEIAANLCGSSKERKRFTRECKMAKDLGCKLYVLIEDNHYKAISDLFGKPIWLMQGRSIPGTQLAQAMEIMQERYGVKFLFCSPDNSAEWIQYLLAKGCSHE